MQQKPEIEGTKRTTAIHKKTSEALAEMLENVRYLARYAVENGQLPKSINIEELYKIRLGYEKTGTVEDKDFGTLVRAYQTIEQRLGPVTIDTLKATESQFDENGKPVPSLAEKYVRFLVWRTYIIIFIILVSQLISFESNSIFILIDKTMSFLIPFLYGTLGADAYVLRLTTHRLHTRQFDPRRKAENQARLVLGTLSGGMIVFFINTGSFSLIGDSGNIYNTLGTAAAGFIAGYSTDFLYDTIERLIGAILPRIGATSRGTQDTPADEVLRKYRRLMEDTDNENEKSIYKALVEDLENKARS